MMALTSPQHKDKSTGILTVTIENYFFQDGFCASNVE